MITKKKKNRKLTSGMILVILTCWIIPYIVVSAALIMAYNKRNLQEITSTVTTAMESSGTIIADNINAAIEDSREASYDGVIKKSYEQFLKDGNESAMYREVTDYLNRTYKYSKTISNTILLYREALAMEYYTYSNVAGATYASISDLKNGTDELLRKTAEDLDTKTRLMDISGHLYVVRNIVLSNYEPFTTLVMEVNKTRMFESLDKVIWQKSGIAVLEGRVIRKSPGDLDKETEERLLSFAAPVAQDSSGLHDGQSNPEPREGEMISWFDPQEAVACLAMKVNGQVFTFADELDKNQIFSGRNAFLSVYAIIFITLIPLLIATFWYFYRNINKPVKALVKGSEKIRSGEYGYRIDDFDKNEEMGQLVDTFNHMSVSLKESFNRIYAEEIAERDATLKALQSQINPHFLNNTLEIINWKARMNGNEDVSEMIGALSVMMNATLNRNNEMFIPLSEELSYVDAYLYIIRERFGSRFRFTREVDDALLSVKIPRLIIQPIVENAVEHGGDRSGSITGSLRIYKEKGFLNIEVENNGTLSDEDRGRIDMLLREDSLSDNERLDRMSIGIRNVNLRLRLLYGEDSGLTIRGEGDNKTISLIRIQQEKEER